jgi:hypothetical protein
MPTRLFWSPDAELRNGTHAKIFRHDPYQHFGKVFYFDSEEAAPTVDTDAPPMGTRHVSLWGAVSFVPYPAHGWEAPATSTAQPNGDGELVRVFIGQLPYFVTDMQLSWLCHTFGYGHLVSHPERIMKRQPNGERLPTGCIHAYATAQAVEEMAQGMHKRMLVDDTGVWHAQTAAEWEALTDYISAMKSDKSLRIPNRPYDSVVVQLAVSTFVPAAPMPLTVFPPERRVKQAAQRSSPPPPPYDAAAMPPPYSMTP